MSTLRKAIEDLGSGLGGAPSLSDSDSAGSASAGSQDLDALRGHAGIVLGGIGGIGGSGGRAETPTNLGGPGTTGGGDTPTAVPEPGAWLTLLAGAAALARGSRLCRAVAMRRGTSRRRRG